MDIPLLSRDLSRRHSPLDQARKRRQETVGGIQILLGLLFLLTTGYLGGQTHLGFDRNDYPGDANLKTLHQTFSYTGYWLNNPPGEKTNTWTGHRAAVESAGFGRSDVLNEME